MLLFRRTPGQTVTVNVLRDGKPQEFKLTLRERAEEMGRMLDLAKPSEQIIQRLGVICIPITKDNLELLPPVRLEYGLIVAGRLADSPLPKDTLQIGDIIHSINNEPVASLEGARKLLDQMKSGSALVLHVERSSKLLYVALDLN